MLCLWLAACAGTTRLAKTITDIRLQRANTHEMTDVFYTLNDKPAYARFPWIVHTPEEARFFLMSRP